MEDMRYVVDLITRINALTKDGKDINTYFSKDAYSEWSFVQYFLVSQIKEFSKDKNYSVFIAKKRPHSRIRSVVSRIGFNSIVALTTLVGILSVFFRTIQVVTFSSDFLNADKKPTPRLRNIYNYFEEKNISFIEILHITSVSAFFKNLPRRSAPGVYYETFAMLGQCISYVRGVRAARAFVQGINLEGFSSHEKELVTFLLHESILRIYAMRVSVWLFERFFSFVKPKAFVSVDDFRYVPEIILAGERVGIPSHVFQHSNFGYLPGMYLLPPTAYNFPTHFYTWNEYWERRVVEISPFFKAYASRISTGGRSFTPLQPPKVERRDPSNETPKELTVLIPYEVSLRSDYIWPYIDAMLASGRITILFVLRGTIDQIDHTMQVNQYVPPQHRDNPRFVKTLPADREKAIRSCDVIAGVYSGFLDESIETGVPIAIFETPFINVNRLDTDNLATLIDLEKGDIVMLFDEARKTPNSVLEERRQRVTRGVKDIRETLERILG